MFSSDHRMKIQSRQLIEKNTIKIATNFYANLYDHKDHGKYKITFYSQTKCNIDWKEEEMERKINRLKSDKALKLARTLLTPIIKKNIQYYK
ncbi:unnamed protein product [Euphydryas editha]|uniref:Uncharacterized protein n=1 Tax=Euphydryas editha TaxID=104508 RepID=A0AAU9TJD2_EUPED|nr:unnamed protein product [Euphydryas editha]